MTDARVGLGRTGETLAADALKKGGYALLARNWRCPFGEVDLIAARGADLYFVEVRTRRTTSAPSPEQSLSPKKIARMETVARAYLGSCETLEQTSWHIGFVAVTMDRAGRVQRITLYPDLEGEPVDLFR